MTAARIPKPFSSGLQANARCAIISDIHGNLVALQAVLRDIESQNIKEIWCLGDIVGYGPEPVECYRLAKARCSIIIKGNHENAMCTGGGLEKFNPRARRAIEWTRRRLETAADILEEIAALPLQFEYKDILFVHGSPRDPTEEYLMPRDARNPRKMRPQFERIKQYVFVGHTHFPGVIEEGEDFVPPGRMMIDGVYMLDGSLKAIINVGSVGQPRDGNPHACYVTFDGDSCVYRRIAYDTQQARRAVHAIPELDRFLGDRLIEGK